MNSYLLFLGSQLSEIRRLLNWTQDDMAKKVGVSRPTIINIEKDPNKMTKQIALALFVIVVAELNQRIKNLELIKFDKWNDKTKRETIIEDIKKYGKINTALIGITSLFSPIAAVVGVVGVAASLFARSSQAIESKEIDAEQVKKVIQETMSSLKAKVTACFGLTSFEITDFVNKIEENEENS